MTDTKTKQELALKRKEVFFLYGNAVVTVALTIFGILQHNKIDELDGKIKSYQITENRRQCLASTNKVLGDASVLLHSLINRHYYCYKGNNNACTDGLNFKTQWQQLTFQEVNNANAISCDEHVSKIWKMANEQITALNSHSRNPGDEIFLDAIDDLNNTLDDIHQTVINDHCCLSDNLSNAGVLKKNGG